MKWKPKSSTERDSASSRSLTSAFGSVSPSSPTTKGTSVVSPVRAAAIGAVVQSSYSGPTWRWQSMSPGSTYLPAASITRAAGGRSDSGPIATIVSPLMATAASKTSEPVTTRPPRTIVSTVIGAGAAGPGHIVGGVPWARRGSVGARAAGPEHSVGGLRPGRRGRGRPGRERSSVRLLLGHGLEEVPVVLWLTPAEEVPALADREHLVEVDPRHDQLVAVRRGAGEHLAQRADDRAPRDQLHAVLDARLGNADHEAEVRVRARTETELVEVERERRAWRVVADENDLRALERKRAIALWVAAILADRDPDPGAGGVEDLVARVAVGEVVGLEDLGEAVGGLGTGEVDLAERPAESAVPIGEERRVEVFPPRLLAEAHMHRDPRLGRAAQEWLERLRRHFGLEELIEVGADLLGEVRRERHLGIGDQLDAFSDRLGEQAQHALDNLLAACALIIRAHLGGGDLYTAYIYTAYIARHRDSPPYTYAGSGVRVDLHRRKRTSIRTSWRGTSCKHARSLRESGTPRAGAPGVASLRFEGFTRFASPGSGSTLVDRAVTKTEAAALVWLLASLGGMGPARAQPPPEGPIVEGPSVSAPASPAVFDQDVRSLPPPPADSPAAVERLGAYSPRVAAPPRRDPLLQDTMPVPRSRSQLSTPILTPPILNFDGARTGANPHDPIGDVGSSHYVQMINSVFTIYSKAGAVLAGPSGINSLWTSAGVTTRSCAAPNPGDPVVLHYPLADPWP